MIAATTKTKIQLKTIVKKQLADTLTPVSLFLRVRDHFTDPVLLESNDFRSKEDCMSFMGLDSIADFRVQNGTITERFPNGKRHQIPVRDVTTVPSMLYDFLQYFEVDYNNPYHGFNGLFGHVGFDGVQYFDTLQFDNQKRKLDIPDIRFTLYRFVIAINHFKDEIYLIENLLPSETSQLNKLETLINGHKYSTHPFKLVGEETSNLTDEEFMQLVTIGKHHCQIGDVFQIVFSRQFAQKFQGDEFNVYRVLRSINPSPYLFYFDYGNYKIFGSSPESQMVIKNGVATVNPIAGTYRRTGDLEEDAQKALELTKDPKENAEHIMLVDLARNDLSRHAENVRVKELKEIHYFSHVIHLVSKVQGDLPPNTNPVQVFADTFPAGTLSGAPKYKAIELINQYENQNRSFYGGSIGFINFNGELLHAIVIRSFLSLNNTLYRQAGAGIVAASEEEKELQEVNNKLGALKRALVEAEKL
ncbi:MAG: anthranilate synthase component I family protein [Saprospiraceae bacterium]|nr:anthranilate synthase component I family protein [Saprospiraceae bacterium]